MFDRLRATPNDEQNATPKEEQIKTLDDVRTHRSFLDSHFKVYQEISSIDKRLQSFIADSGMSPSPSESIKQSQQRYFLQSIELPFRVYRLDAGSIIEEMNKEWVKYHELKKCPIESCPSFATMERVPKLELKMEGQIKDIRNLWGLNN